jgi:signal transduction histidine kinase
MSSLRIGVVGGVPFVEALASRHPITRFGEDRVDLAQAPVDAWIVSAGVSSDEVLSAVLRHGAPVLLLATGTDVDERIGRIEPGRVDVARMPASAIEAEARINALVGCSVRWSEAASRLCTTAAHDLRSPLQGLRFTLSALAREGALAGDWAEDFDMLEAVADTFEVQLHGLYNLGRRLADEVDEVVDLSSMIAEDTARPYFRDRVDPMVSGPLWVRGHSGDLRYALLDVLRVMSQLAPGSRRVTVSGRSAGEAVVVEVTCEVYPGVLERPEALLSRSEPVLLRSKVRLPFAGLAFAQEAMAASGGTLVLKPGGASLTVALTFPALKVGPGTSLG